MTSSKKKEWTIISGITVGICCLLIGFYYWGQYLKNRAKEYTIEIHYFLEPASAFVNQNPSWDKDTIILQSKIEPKIVGRNCRNYIHYISDDGKDRYIMTLAAELNTLNIK